MLLLLLLLGLIIYTNARLAKKKGKNPVLWGVISLVAFFVSYAMLGVLYISFVYKGPYNQEAMKAYLMNEPLTVLMLLMLGVGGMLVVRFILERSKSGEAS